MTYVKCLTPRCECERGHEERGEPEHMDARGRRWKDGQIPPGKYDWETFKKLATESLGEGEK